MMDGFPEFKVEGNKQMFTFRFPKFENTSFYDPIFAESSGDEGSEGSEGSTSTATTPTVGSAASQIYPLSYAFLAFTMMLGSFIDLFN